MPSCGRPVPKCKPACKRLKTVREITVVFRTWSMLLTCSARWNRAPLTSTTVLNERRIYISTRRHSSRWIGNDRLGSSPIRRREKKSRPQKRSAFMLKDPGRTYFRACGHYHWPCELNVRVRNGNGCFLTSDLPGNHRRDNRVARSCV